MLPSPSIFKITLPHCCWNTAPPHPASSAQSSSQTPNVPLNPGCRGALQLRHFFCHTQMETDILPFAAAASAALSAVFGRWKPWELCYSCTWSENTLTFKWNPRNAVWYFYYFFPKVLFAKVGERVMRRSAEISWDITQLLGFMQEQGWSSHVTPSLQHFRPQSHCG